MSHKYKNTSQTPKFGEKMDITSCSEAVLTLLSKT
jgi:hypothetical protein